MNFMDTGEWIKDVTATVVLIAMAWYLLRNLVTNMNTSQKEIAANLQAHASDTTEKWIKHTTEQTAEHKALLDAASNHGEACQAHKAAIEALVDQINGG